MQKKCYRITVTLRSPMHINGGTGLAERFDTIYIGKYSSNGYSKIRLTGQSEIFCVPL